MLRAALVSALLLGLGAACFAQDPAADGVRPQPPPIQVSVKDVFFSHLHNKVVHFPLALGITGALFLLLSYRRPQLLPAARLLLVLAALTALAAYLTGREQKEDFEDGALALYLERHELLGKLSGATLALTAALSFVPSARRFLWLLALAVLMVLSMTGLLGGILSHTPV